MALPVLDATEQRIIGSLLEKQRTVPASYPLSLNSLRLACNQTTSRDPITDLDDGTIEAACRQLKARGLLRVVWVGKGARALKYHQLLDEVLALQPDERAVLTALLLGGPQAPGELKTRTERLHAFADRGVVETVLARMAALPDPLVTELPLRAGQQDRRWAHVLGPSPADVSQVSAGVDREVVLAAGAQARDAEVQAAYEASAQAYSDTLLDELTGKPFDVWLLERIADLSQGPIADVGCGPGQIAAFLADTGVEVHGFDASPAMVAVAQANFPDLPFTVSRFHQLLRPPSAAAWGAVVAWYSFVHLAPSELAGTLGRLASTVRDGGLVAFALHLGEEVVRPGTLCGVAIDLAFVLHDREQVLTAVAAAGLVDVEWYVRGPYPDEAQTDRLYVVARTG